MGVGGGLMTTNGGGSWASMALDVCESDTNVWTSLVFSGARSPGELWAASSDGVICVSADYGVSWEPQTGESQVRHATHTPITAHRPEALDLVARMNNQIGRRRRAAIA